MERYYICSVDLTSCPSNETDPPFSPPVTGKEVTKLLKRYSCYVQDGNQGISVKDFLGIPELSTNPIMPLVAEKFHSAGSSRMSAKSFVKALSQLSPRSSLEDKRKCRYTIS